ncbi:hypothetical protein BBJ28_00021703, partial [Nothophytophthora sp. Chile5]
LNPSTNNVTVGNELFPIRSNASPDEHTLYVWDSIISRAQARNVYVLAYSFGAKSVLTLIQKREEQVVQRVNALVFAEGAYRLDPATTPPSVGQFLRQRAINFKGDGQIPVGGHVPAAEEQLSCCCLSVGDLTTSAPTADGRPPPSTSAPASALSKRSSSNKARTISLSLETTFTYFVAARDRGCSAAQFISESETKTRSANMDAVCARAEMSERLRASRGREGHANGEPNDSWVPWWVSSPSLAWTSVVGSIDTKTTFGVVSTSPWLASRGVFCVNCPTEAHEAIANCVITMIMQQVLLAGNQIALMSTLVVPGAPMYDVGDRNQVPDLALKHVAAALGIFPKLSVQVAYATESWGFCTEANMDFARARAELSQRLRADADRGGEGHANEEPDYSPVVVFESICRQDFRRWLDQHEGELRRWHYEPLAADSGRVVVYSSTIPLHARVGSGIVIKVVRQIVEAGRSTDLIATVEMERAPRIDVGDRDQEPDGAVTPAAAEVNAFPTFVVEVAGFHESWTLLEERLERWMTPNTTVQVAIGVKYDATNRRVLLLQRDGAKVTRNVVDFAVGQSEPVAFPLRALYYGVELPELLAGHEDDPIQIDLAWLRGVLDRFM